ncbi:hypothetical protein D3C78_20840 [compost metagenome]
MKSVKPIVYVYGKNIICAMVIIKGLNFIHSHIYSQQLLQIAMITGFQIIEHAVQCLYLVGALVMFLLFDMLAIIVTKKSFVISLMARKRYTIDQIKFQDLFSLLITDRHIWIWFIGQIIRICMLYFVWQQYSQFRITEIPLQFFLNNYYVWMILFWWLGDILWSVFATRSILVFGIWSIGSRRVFLKALENNSIIKKRH